jgi:hypothetical protein
MNNILLLDLSDFEKKTTLDCLFLFANIILHMIINKKQILILDDKDKSNHNLIDILNIEKINIFLNEKYNIFLFLKSFLNFNLLNVKYGLHGSNIDLTNYIYIHYYKKNVLLIPENTNINEMCGDPVPFKEKFIFVKYSLNKHIFEDVYLENGNFLLNEIYYDFKNMKHYLNILDFNETFHFPLDLLSNIVLNQDLYQFTENFYYNNFIKEDKINIIYIHIDDKNIKYNYVKKDNYYFNIINDNIFDFAVVSEKLEEEIEEIEDVEEKEDFINENSIRDIVTETLDDIVNTIYKDDYKNLLERKYIDTIKNHISIKDKNIVISNIPDNKVIDYLKKNNYTIYFMNDQLNEDKSLNELLITRFCNNKFIGCLDETTINKDYYIRQLLEKNILQLLIDKNNLDKECIYYTCI